MESIPINCHKKLLRGSSRKKIMTAWHLATLIDNRPVGPGLHRIALDVPLAVRQHYHTPGQYHRVRIPNHEDAHFALASPPQHPHFEYLIRVSEGVAGAWAAMPVGASVEVSLAEGPGFPLHRARKKNLLLVGTGTGFAPLHAVVETLRTQRADFGRVFGAYGVWSPAQLAFGYELPAWAREGIDIVPTVSVVDESWTGAVGQVQGIIPTFSVENTVAFLCGQPEMVAEVTTILIARGISPAEIFLNLP